MLVLTEFILNNPIISIILFIIALPVILYGYCKFGEFLEGKNKKIYACIFFTVIISFVVFLSVNQNIAEYMFKVFILFGLVYGILSLIYSYIFLYIRA